MLLPPRSRRRASGQFEDKINRLKAAKGQMYARAKIDLFKTRVMVPA